MGAIPLLDAPQLGQRTVLMQIVPSLNSVPVVCVIIAVAVAVAASSTGVCCVGGYWNVGVKEPLSCWVASGAVLS